MSAFERTLRYDTIRDAILTHSQKLTRVAYSTALIQQPKGGKTEKVKSKKRVCSEVSVNSPGNPWSQSQRKKEGFAVGRICGKGRFKPGMKEWAG